MQTTCCLLALIVAIATMSTAAMSRSIDLDSAPHHDYNAHWNNFKVKHRKSYSDPWAEEERKSTFIYNMEIARELNAHNKHATFGVTKFSDMTPEEFQRVMLRPNLFKLNKRSHDYRPVENIPDDSEVAGTAVDWRSKYVTRVKNQGQCGSCWAFSTIGAIEGQHARVHNKLVRLSEQQLVSCDTVNEDCSGGFMDKAMKYLIEKNNGTVYTESSVPYTSGRTQKRGDCPVSGVKGARILNYTKIEASEEALAIWVKRYGPVSIAVDSTMWHHYVRGIITMCLPTTMNHAVLLVGYNTTATPPYWIVKNSWGTSWGEKGYIRLRMGGNTCLIRENAVAAMVE